MKTIWIVIVAVMAGSHAAVSQEEIPVLQPEIGTTFSYSIEEGRTWEKYVELNFRINSSDTSYETISETDKVYIDSLEMGFGPLTQGPGCSWYCGGGPYKVVSEDCLPGQKGNTYVADNLHDFNLLSGWAPDSRSGITGKQVHYYFKPFAPRITAILVYNGYMKNEEVWRQNARAKRLKVYVNHKPYAILQLADEPSLQTFKIPPLRSTIKEKDLILSFEVLDIYPGSKWNDLVISEINFDGIDVH